jgi:hypothetical protein
METVTPGEAAGAKLRGLYHSNQVAAFDFSERRIVFAGRIMNCIRRAFDALGTSSATQEVIFWNLQVTRSLWLNDIVERPEEFIDGLKAIYGEAGAAVFEYMFTKEIEREFNISAALDEEGRMKKGFVDLLRLVAP